MSRRKSSLIAPGYKATDKDVEQLKSLVAQAFQESQKTIASHRKLIISLTNIQERAIEADLETVFTKFFCQCLNRLLPVKRTEKTAERVVKLVEGFSKHIQEKYAPKEVEDDDDSDTVASRFTDDVVRHLLRGVTSKDKLVRARSCQLIAAIVNGLQEIDDELYDSLKFHLSSRLYDKEQTVRLNSALALTRLQDDPDNITDGTFSITKLLLNLLQHDSSPEVRRAILFNLEKSSLNLPYLLERASDVHPTNRRSVYSRTIKEIGDFRLLSIGMREKLLHWGLKDRDPSVRKAATKMFLGLWLHNANDDLLELLERLDVLNSKIASTAMDVFFANRRDALDKMEFTDEFWKNLTPESIFLVRKFNDFCVKEKLSQLLEERMPELTKIGFIIEHYLQLLHEDTSDPEMEFIVEQLLTIAETYDYGDEIGRRKLNSLLHDALLNNEFNDTLIKCCVAIIRKISVKESDFSQFIVELVSDIRDPFMANKKDEEEEEEEGEDHAEKELLATIKSLSIAQSTLELVERPIEENVYLSSLLDTLIIDSVRNHESRIRERGLFCLGLCCLLSKKLAIDNILLFGHCYTKGDTNLKILAIKTISDILTIHGTQILDLEESVDTLTIYKMYYKAVRNDDDPDTQTVAAISLCKLLLAGIINEPDLVKTLVVVYFNGNSSYNQSLRQALTYCIPVYCFSSSENQKVMASVVVDSVRRLTLLYETADVEEMLNPTQILQQLIDWTNPSRVVRLNSSGQMADGGGKDDVQCYVAIDMMNRLLDDKAPGKDERKALISGFTRLYIPDTTPIEQLKELFELIDEYVSEGDITEAYAKNAMQRFYNEIKSTIERAEQLLVTKPEEKEEEELVLIHGANENPEESTQKDSEESAEKEAHEEETEPVESELLAEVGEGPAESSLVAEPVAEDEAEEENQVENSVSEVDRESEEEESGLKSLSPEADVSESEDEAILDQTDEKEPEEKDDYEEEEEEEDDDDDDLIPETRNESGSRRTSSSSRTSDVSHASRSTRSKSRASAQPEAVEEEADAKSKSPLKSTKHKSKSSKAIFKGKSLSKDKSKDKSKSRKSKSSRVSHSRNGDDNDDRPSKRQRRTPRRSG
ncbi:similar to Saccharomyces cerevisiae YDR325W YCG1 Subunit of the condensin complex [Geotrichum candidum]|uniref:Similar to Saccharomyces cerevisiae YDR325W YCG1 Subunit of the condensin complex n=1 Tax=Geotrichum candidum TaxID=1173061 RepID=A0A0J9XKB5_GEOCN|nr:similar to Saccharomyces cerevisiae YDR325W YCG1 Subunit of the condensin complex [Geotrichum candidum]